MASGYDKAASTAAEEGVAVAAPDGSDVVVVGAGNIGSHLVGHLAREGGIRGVTIIDSDRFDVRNISAQDIVPREVGKAKAAVLARRLRQIRPGLRVSAFEADVESLPLGLLRADVLLSCLDSRGARRYLNQVAWRLGVPFVDAGVETSGMLVRVAIFVPTPEAPCYECSFDDADYAALADSYSCEAPGPHPLPTNAPSCLGALAASLQAIECRKLIDGRFDEALIGREVVLDTTSHRHFLTRLHRNPRCRFDHRTWTIEHIDSDPSEISLGGVLSLAQRSRPERGNLQLGVEGKQFIRLLHCSACGRSRKVRPRLAGRLRPSAYVCRECGEKMVASGFDSLDRLRVSDAQLANSQSSLASFGLRSGDVFELSTCGAGAHFQIGRLQDGDPRKVERWT